jgi:hypothetical protein
MMVDDDYHGDKIGNITNNMTESEATMLCKAKLGEW